MTERDEASAPAPVAARDIADLLRKYGEIARLRHAASLPDEPDPRHAMASLAAEFPGALREADELPWVEIQRRLAALRIAEPRTEAAPAWVAPMARFHVLARGALSAKRWLAGRRKVDRTLLDAFRAEASALPYPAEAMLWSTLETLASVAQPPRGRVTEAVWQRLSAERGVTVANVRLLVFERWRTKGNAPLD